MNFSQGSAAHFVPLLARIALCVIFIPAGWGKIMGEQAFSGSEISTLKELGVLISTDSESATTEEASEVKTRALYRDAMVIKEHDLPYPVVGAWLIALTQLLGGGLVLIGLFTRIMAFGFAVIMGFAFAIVSIPAIDTAGGIFDLPPPVFYQAAAQIGLAVLAAGLVFSGAGWASIDAAIFSHGKSVSRKGYQDDFDDEDEDDEDYE
ncbi:MAG: DoxX family membrane protein [Phycisphaerales bacterium]|nr:DoxX family membrane protein [Phycisphaerales bacterium]